MLENCSLPLTKPCSWTGIVDIQQVYQTNKAAFMVSGYKFRGENSAINIVIFPLTGNQLLVERIC